MLTSTKEQPQKKLRQSTCVLTLQTLHESICSPHASCPHFPCVFGASAGRWQARQFKEASGASVLPTPWQIEHSSCAFLPTRYLNFKTDILARWWQHEGLRTTPKKGKQPRTGSQGRAHSFEKLGRFRPGSSPKPGRTLHLPRETQLIRKSP
jgi:hypothetical protein